MEAMEMLHTMVEAFKDRTMVYVYCVDAAAKTSIEISSTPCFRYNVLLGHCTVDSSRVHSLITDLNTLENVALFTLPLKPKEPEDGQEQIPYLPWLHFKHCSCNCSHHPQFFESKSSCRTKCFRRATTLSQGVGSMGYVDSLLIMEDEDHNNSGNANAFSEDSAGLSQAPSTHGHPVSQHQSDASASNVNQWHRTLRTDAVDTGIASQPKRVSKSCVWILKF
ncbi:hypothetical protein ACROYT_G014746 [Oculina patagonica]